ncbi:MAG TPA: hypothetical protein VFU93_00110 [Acidimicrobiales bacterium]|nr:hypothetical protein [Acidimicrobiales bacterium]
MEVSPTPTDEELAAIVAAHAALAKSVVVVAEEPSGPSTAWRFSGRWWSRPVASRRFRP